MNLDAVEYKEKFIDFTSDLTLAYKILAYNKRISKVIKKGY